MLLQSYFKLDFTAITYRKFLGGTWYGSYKHFQKRQNIIMIIVIIIMIIIVVIIIIITIIVIINSILNTSVCNDSKYIVFKSLLLQSAIKGWSPIFF